MTDAAKPPLPLSLNDEERYYIPKEAMRIVHFDEGRAIEIAEINEDAEAYGPFIVHAANAHDDLLAALKDTLRMLEAAHMQLGMHPDSNKRVIKARAAVAKAESQS